MAYSVSKSKNIIVEYIWLGLDNEIFSKVRIIRPGQLVQNRSSEYIEYKDIPDWDYDGSSTGQATTESSEVILKPCALYKNPFHNKELQSFIVLCSTYNPDGNPLESNTRHNAVYIFLEEDVVSQDIWFGIEFEYMMYSKATGQPISERISERTNYCSIVAVGKNIVEEHMMMCLDAGIGYDGYNSEVVGGQWEYQIFGKGIAVADQSIVARYILERIVDKHDIYINWHFLTKTVKESTSIVPPRR